MKGSEDILKKVEETLNVVERLDKVGPRPFFYTRLMARLDRMNEKAIQYRTVKRIQYAVFGLFLLFTINGYTLYKLLPLQPIEQQSPTMETFIENYQLDVRNIYYIGENDLN